MLISMLCTCHLQGPSLAVPECVHQALPLSFPGPLPGSPRMSSSGFAPIISRAPPWQSPNVFAAIISRAPPRQSPNVFIRLCTYYFQGPSWAVPKSCPPNRTLHILFPGPSSAIPKPLSFFLLLVRFTLFLGHFISSGHPDSSNPAGPAVPRYFHSHFSGSNLNHPLMSFSCQWYGHVTFSLLDLQDKSDTQSSNEIKIIIQTTVLYLSPIFESGFGFWTRRRTVSQ
jgi:hypothetical protein